MSPAAARTGSNPNMGWRLCPANIMQKGLDGQGHSGSAGVSAASEVGNAEMES